MRLIVLLLCFGYCTHAQSTLQVTAPSETFDLTCPTCKIRVDDIAVVKGHQVLPFNLAKGEVVNLLHWRYFDKFLNKMTTYPRPLYGEQCVQLLDDLQPTDTVSLHINLTFTSDSLNEGARQQIFLLIGGVQKKELYEKALSGEYSEDLFDGHRFAAIAQITPLPKTIDVYEITEGLLSIDLLDIKNDKYRGTFEFFGEQIGIVKKGFFVNGVLKKE
jgi:hypothetical protein